MRLPEELRYTKEHEWAKIEGKIATVGITEFAVHQLGDITLVELPDVGRFVKAGQAIGTIESVKAVSDLFSPLTGKVVGANSELEDAPEKLNEEPYGQGWMIKIELSDDKEISGLLGVAGYKALVDAADK